MPRARGRALRRAVPRRSPTARSRSTAAPTAHEVREALLALPGIGPWTADYIATARARRPRRLPADRHRRPQRAGRPGRRPDPRRPRPRGPRGDPGAPTPCCTCGARSPCSTPTRSRGGRLTMWTAHRLAHRRAAHRRARRRDHRDRVQPVPTSPPTVGPRCRRRPPLLVRAVAQLTAYFARELKEFDLPLAPHGTAVPAAGLGRSCSAIGYGDTASYGEVAHRIGMTNAASRAVGLANGRNPHPDRDPVPPGGRCRTAR